MEFPLIKLKTSNHGTAAANTAVAITVTALPDQQHVLAGVVWSYSAAPTGGKLTVADGASTVLEVDIIAGGPGSLVLPPLGGSTNTNLVVTLAAGGAGIIGKLTVFPASV